jgi:hypothetical protein
MELALDAEDAASGDDVAGPLPLGAAADAAATGVGTAGASGALLSVRVTKKIATMIKIIAANAPHPMSFCLPLRLANYR